MKLNIDFDDALIKKYAGRGRSPLIALYWTHDGQAYPENGWLDFGSVVLSWWLVAAKSLVEGAAEVELPFMDGPFRLMIRSHGNMLSVTSDDYSWQWRTTMESFAFELLTATKHLQNKLTELGMADTEGLQTGVQHLRAAISQAKKASAHHRPLVAESAVH